MSKPLIPAQRRERIQEYLVTHKIVRMDDLYTLLDTSEATVRRDLEWLEREGIVERTNGGAILSQRLTLEPEYLQRAKKHPEEQRLIGEKAALLIEDNDVVFINSGTTTTQVIRHIRGDAGITVFSNNVYAALEVGEAGFKHHLIGGELQPHSNSVSGRFAIDNLRQVYADKAILGVDGVSLKHGCTVPSNAEAEVIKQMIERTQGKVFIVADSSKWGVVSNFQIAAIDEIDKFVTDESIDSSAKGSLTAHSVESLIASPRQIKT
ncbi:MAG: DeoR/GlpR family DNA-binding transcription regulator [Chloroflexi bacterium]|nr:DeoR/GlpR family DNA-binding transcription regulator [Chloroflexota bacterium]